MNTKCMQLEDTSTSYHQLTAILIKKIKTLMKVSLT